MEQRLKTYKDLLEWYQTCGVDALMSDEPRNHYTNEPALFSLSELIRPQTKQLHSASAPKQIDMVKSEPVIEKSLSPTIVETPTVTKQVDTILSDHPALACETLDELRHAIENVTGCDLIKAATHTVFSGGDPNSSIMIIGEAPGADEDRLGQPFVGQSGQLLNTIFATIGVSREDVYISNIIPWRPPGNRPPTTSEVNFCLPFIKRHIDLASPKILILLGGVAVKGLLGLNDGILKLRGQIFDYKKSDGTTISAMPTFHPSYVMRAPSQKAQVWKDMLTLKRWLKEHKDS